jgi:hypothetical protein
MAWGGRLTPYWLVFMLPLLGVLFPARLAPDLSRFAWVGFGLLVALLVGFRYQVGGDWYIYLDMYEEMRDMGFRQGFAHTDPGYWMLTWLSHRLGWGIYGVNLACGLLFVAGFALFARRQPMPWLAWLIVVPYLLIVVVMGYSRQGVALGLIFAALAGLEDRRVARFVVLVGAAAMFHKSATLILPFAFVLYRQRGGLYIVALTAALLAAAAGFLYAQFEFLWFGYVEHQQQSEGAAVRVLMNAVPAALMLLLMWHGIWRRRWPDAGHWRYIGLASIAALFVVGLASTAVDRLALYLAPVQVYVWTRMPLLFGDRALRTAVTLAVCLLYGAVLWVWLNLGVHAQWWLPYRSFLLE